MSRHAFDIQCKQEAREKAGHRLETKTCFHFHMCLLFVLTTDNGLWTVLYRRWFAICGLKNKNSFIHLGTKEISAVPPELRFQVGTFKRFNVQTC
jgi:hypothetical protein